MMVAAKVVTWAETMDLVSVDVLVGKSAEMWVETKVDEMVGKLAGGTAVPMVEQMAAVKALTKVELKDERLADRMAVCLVALMVVR